MIDTVAVPLSDTIKISEFYKPWEHQIRFHTMKAKHRLQIGGFGSGKSRPLLMEAICYALEYPGVNVGMVRKTMPDLKRTVIDKFEADIPKGIYEKGSQEKGTFNKSDHIVWFPPVLMNGQWRQSKLYFIACETERDVGKYLSTEFAFLGFEELGEFPFVIFDALVNRNRTTIPDCRPTVGAATNPMGIGWSWIKKIFIDKQPCYGMDPELYDPSDYDYVHSTVEDNPILFENKEYVRSLEKSPLRDRIRWGKLDVTTGQFFDNWDVNRHYRPASDFIFEPWQPTVAAIDYGFGHFSAMVFMTKAILKPRFDGDKPKVVNVVTRELYMQEKTPEEQIHAFIASIPRTYDKETREETGYAEQIEAVYFSWERFNRTVSNRTVADEVGDLLRAAGLPGPTRSNTDRVAGWTKIYSLLEVDELFILKNDGFHRGCPQLAEAIPLLVRGNGTTKGQDIEDVVKPPGVSLVDDLGDALRMCIAGALLDAEDKPKELQFKERIQAIKDPLRRHVEQFREYQKQQKENRSGPKQISVPSWYQRVKPQ